MIDITVSAGKVARFFIWVIVILTVANLAVRVLGHAHPAGINVPWSVRRLFHSSEEENFPTYFSSVLLLLASMLLFLIGYAKRRQKDRFCRHWNALGAVMLFLSIDELCAIHEELIHVIPASLWANYNFMPVYGPLMAILLAAMLPFLANLPRKTLWWFIIAGCIYVGAAGGIFEIPGAKLRVDWLFKTAKVLEELGEQTGMTLFIYGLLVYFSKYIPVWRVSFGDAKSGESPAVAE
jgi:hypothetical protein